MFFTFLHELHRQHGSNATNSLKHQFSLNHPEGRKDSKKVFIDPTFAKDIFTEMGKTGASNIRVTTTIDQNTGKELITYIQWYSNGPKKHELKYK